MFFDTYAVLDTNVVRLRHVFENIFGQENVGFLGQGKFHENNKGGNVGEDKLETAWWVKDSANKMSITAAARQSEENEKSSCFCHQ